MPFQSFNDNSSTRALGLLIIVLPPTAFIKISIVLLVFKISEIVFVTTSSFVGGLASQFGLDLSGRASSTFSQQNIVELLKSRRVVVSTLLQDAIINGKNNLLIEHYLEINKIKDSWNEEQIFSSISFCFIWIDVGSSWGW